MRIALNDSLRGMKRATQQVETATSRIARWGLDTSDEMSQSVNGDEVRIDGAERPRNVLNQQWGRGPDGLSPEVDLSEEAIRLKAGEWAFRANIAATRSVLDLEKRASELVKP